jgi:hypothetical protein
MKQRKTDMAERKVYTSLTTPVGIARYPHLNEADEYKGAKNFKTDLILDPEEDGVQDLLDTITEKAEEMLAKTLVEWKEKGGKHAANAKKLELHVPFGPEYDDEGDETGRIVLKAKKKAEYEVKGKLRTSTLPIFDAAKTKLTDCDPIWGGSRIRLSVELFPFASAANDLAGISLRMKGVQLIELKTGTPATADDMGFGEVEDGYTAAASEEFEAGAGDGAEDVTEF